MGAGEVHVWRARLKCSADVHARLWTSLSTDERSRARRYRFADDRDSFVVARGILRAILARYTGIEPAMLRFRYGSQGKPELDAPDSTGAIAFNLAHSGGLAVYALARGRRVGVDIEAEHANQNHARVSEMFFSQLEIDALRQLPPKVQPEAFLACWTRKEAFLKATSEGLSRVLDEFQVSTNPDDSDPRLCVASCPEETTRWRLMDLDVAAGYRAAICVEGRVWQARFFDWALE
jgi:4'-phosphopantetheinyl transferase